VDVTSLNRLLLFIAAGFSLFAINEMRKFLRLAGKSRIGKIGGDFVLLFLCGFVYVLVSLLINEKIVSLPVTGETFGYFCVTFFFVMLARLALRFNELI